MKLTNLYHEKESFEAVIWIGNHQELKAPFDELRIVPYVDSYVDAMKAYGEVGYVNSYELCPICGCSMNTHGYSKLLESRICPGSCILKDSAGDHYIYSKETVFNYFGKGKEESK